MPNPSDARYRAWYPAVRPAPDPNTFEIGLVLAGAVSAGAYTAGVLDFLYEALDCWHHAKLDDVRAGRTGEDRTVPHHEVRLNIVTGASAGGMNGAISAVALRYDYPRAWSDEKIAAVEAETEPGSRPPTAVDRARNPFYWAWVEQIDITKLLGTSDLDTGFHSLLDCTSLDDIVRTVLAYRGDALDERGVRAWLHNPLPLILTVTNLRGVPYRIAFRGQGGEAHEMSLHQDHMGFAIRGLGPESDNDLPDDFLVLDPAKPEGWDKLGDVALATGAFPLGLRARTLARNGSDYDARYPIFPLEQSDPVFDSPAWPDGAAPPDYRFLCVDGGVLNNEPFEIARRTLSGVNGHNETSGARANRAVVMIDPFVEPGPLGPDRDVDLLKVMVSMLGALKNQVRFTPRDRALILCEDVYSRFLIAPSRRGTKSGAAIASGGLGAFAGFLCHPYRHHDFMLGRRNCQRFLQASFTLPEGNPVFQGAWSQAARKAYRDRVSDDHLQIIPCVGPCAVEEPRPRWPVNAFTYNKELESLVDGRMRRLVSEVMEHLSGRRDAKSWWGNVTNFSVGMYLYPIERTARKKIKAKLQDRVGHAVATIDGRYPDELR